MTASTHVRLAAVGVDAPWQQRAVDEARGVEGVTVVASSRDADVVLAFSDSAAANDCGQPPLGVWRYAFGDGAAVAGGARGTLARLTRDTGDPSLAIVLHEGWYRARTAEGWGTPSVPARIAPWASRILTQIVAGDRDAVAGPAQPTDGCRDRDPPHQHDPFGLRLADATRDWFTRQRWSVGIVAMRIEEILQRGRMPEPAWLVDQPADRFYADPFPLHVDGDRVHLLVEEYHYASRRKTIVGLDVTERGVIFGRRLEDGLPLQASYPFVLRDEGKVVCVPETFRAVRASAFEQNGAARWRHVGDLLAGFPAIDSTIVRRDGRWWLFCTKQGDEDQTELHLFFADDWRGPWQPHPLNPVKSDTRSSRPAGACFEIDGALYRPAQNCARRYGAGLALNRIAELSITKFREDVVWTHAPSADSPWPHGIHTLNGCGAITVVDGLRLERRLGPARWSGRH